MRIGRRSALTLPGAFVLAGSLRPARAADKFVTVGIDLSLTSHPFASVIDPDDPSFLLPPRMPDAIVAYCRRTGQAEPATPGSIVRTALEGLALRYRWVIERLEELTGRRLDAIHVVGR